MKKSIILLIIFSIISITLFIVVNKKQQPDNYEYNNDFSKTTKNYIDNELYSTNKETISLYNGILTYTSNVIYTDKNIEPITITYYLKYKENKDSIETNDKTYYVNDTRLCLETIKCEEPYTIYGFIKENKKENITKKKYITTKKSIKPSEKGTELYVVIDQDNKLTPPYKRLLNKIIFDFDIKVNYIELTKKNKNELTEKYNITNPPTTLLFVNGELKDTEEQITTHKSLYSYLYFRGIDYR